MIDRLVASLETLVKKEAVIAPQASPAAPPSVRGRGSPMAGRGRGGVGVGVGAGAGAGGVGIARGMSKLLVFS